MFYLSHKVVLGKPVPVVHLWFSLEIYIYTWKWHHWLIKTTTTIFQYFLLWKCTGNLIVPQSNYFTTIAIFHWLDRHYHHHLQKERLPGGERMGKTESFVYFRVVVLFHNLNTKQSQLILAVWNWMDVDKMDKMACCSPSQLKPQTIYNCYKLILALADLKVLYHNLNRCCWFFNVWNCQEFPWSRWIYDGSIDKKCWTSPLFSTPCLQDWRELQRRPYHPSSRHSSSSWPRRSKSWTQPQSAFYMTQK